MYFSTVKKKLGKHEKDALKNPFLKLFLNPYLALKVAPGILNKGCLIHRTCCLCFIVCACVDSRFSDIYCIISALLFEMELKIIFIE